MKAAGLTLLACATIAAGAPLTLETRIPLPGVFGRIDHLAVDIAGNRLFVAALGNNTVEVIDIAASRQTNTITGMRKPQGLLYEPNRARLFVASGDDGALRTYDGRTLQPLAQATGLPDADNVRWDAAHERVLVGYGEGALGIFDVDGRKIADIRLPGHPESFQVDPGSGRVFVNVPNRQRVIVIDLAKHAIAAEWTIAVAANFPMALDMPRRRLFLGARRPARVLVLDTDTGRTLAAEPCVGDADDLFYDAARGRAYVIGGEGYISAFDTKANSKADIPTAPGARTGLFVPEMRKLFVAAPKRGSREAAILVYAVP